MASPHPNQSTGEPMPPSSDVADPMLFKLATDIAAAHHPAADGACVSLLCRDRPYPCEPARLAHRAVQKARRSTAEEPTPAPPPEPPARGRATVPTSPARVTGPSGFAAIMQPTVTPRVPAEPGAAPVFAPFRRPTVPIPNMAPQSAT
jgi:hypothetical protein